MALTGSRITSATSSTAKTIRSFVGEALVHTHEPPTRYELVWGTSARGGALPVAVAALVCVGLDWNYAGQIGKEYSNTLLCIALIASLVLNGFLFSNLVLSLQDSPRASRCRRFLAYVDVVIVILIIMGSVIRTTTEDEAWGSTDGSVPIDTSTSENARMLIFTFCLVLAVLHFVAGGAMALAATRNWVQIQKLSPEEYRDYREGLRPLYPPPAYA